MGPCFTRIFMTDVTFLDRHIAHQNEYLVVKFKNGRKEHIRGPHSIFCDPVVHQSISVEKALELSDGQVLVVYTETDPERDAVAVLPVPLGVNASAALADDKSEEKSGEAPPTPTSTPFCGRNVQRRIVMGPTLYTPAANEWLHNFSWHGRVPESKARYKAAHLQFNKLRTLPSTLYYNISECRTSDDAELEVKLMIFYHLESLSTMLDNTHDPIGEILNGVCADVIRFSSENTFLSFVQRTAILNDLTTFSVLQSRAKAVGYVIDKVVFRGYKASDQLQQMHDQAVKMRTKLRLDSEAQEQEQQLLEMKLAKSMERAEKEHEMSRSNQRHELAIQAEEHKQKMRQQAEEMHAQLEQKRLQVDQETAFLTALADKGVDLTKYLCSKNEKVESLKVMRIETNEQTSSSSDGKESSKNTTHIHMNE